MPVLILVVGVFWAIVWLPHSASRWRFPAPTKTPDSRALPTDPAPI